MRQLPNAFVVVAAVAAMACGSHAAAKPAAGASTSTKDTVPQIATSSPADTRKRILFIGTSLTAGYGLDPDSAYPALIQRKIDSAGLSYDAVNAGVSGETTSGLLSRLDWVLRAPVDLVVLESGANDGLRAIPVASVEQDLQKAIDQIKRSHPEATIALVQMEALPNYGPAYTSAFRAIYPALAKRNGITLIPFLLNGVAGRPELNQQDGVHPNLRGEPIVAENVWRSLRPLLKRGS